MESQYILPWIFWEGGGQGIYCKFLKYYKQEDLAFCTDATKRLKTGPNRNNLLSFKLAAIYHGAEKQQRQAVPKA